MFRIYRENCNKSFGKKGTIDMRTELGQGSVSMVVGWWRGGSARVNDSVALSNVHGCPEKHLRKKMMR